MHVVQILVSDDTEVPDKICVAVDFDPPLVGIVSGTETPAQIVGAKLIKHLETLGNTSSVVTRPEDD